MAEESIVEYEIDDSIKTNENSKYEVADAIETKDSEYEASEPTETKEYDEYEVTNTIKTTEINEYEVTNTIKTTESNEYEVTDTIKTTESNEYEIGDTHDTGYTDDAQEESNIPDEVEENVLGTKEYDESGVNLDLPQIQESENSAAANAEKRWPGWPGENVFRMLVPVQKVGSIIGRKGEYIKKITEETRARIKILDGPPGTLERAVMVSGKEEPDVAIPPAMEGLLRVHKRIIDLDSDTANEGAGGVVSTRLLVADTQAGSLIGKQGSTIKSIQDDSGCTIRVLGAEHLPLFALQGDSLVEVQGESAGVHKAVELIATHLRKFLVDRSVISVFETLMQMPNARAIPDIPRHDSWGPPQGFSIGAGGGHGYAPSSQYMQQPGPPRHFDEYYPSSDLPPLEKQTRPSAYGREAAMGMHSGGQAQSSMITKVTQHMQIPLSYADAVIGTSGANISYIRRASGATIAIQETRGLPDEMTVEICGSAAQIQTAQQLIQNFMAEAASSKQNPSSGSAGQEYNSYPTQSSMHTSPSSNPAGHAGYTPPGDYGQVYGSNYGY